MTRERIRAVPLIAVCHASGMTFPTDPASLLVLEIKFQILSVLGRCTICSLLRELVSVDLLLSNSTT